MYHYSNPLWTRALVTRWSASTKAAVRSGSLLAAQISQMLLALRSECVREWSEMRGYRVKVVCVRDNNV